MKKLYHLLLAVLLLTGCNFNQPKYKRIKLENSLLWQISGNGLSSPSYIYGTDHLIGRSFLDTLPWVMQKFLECGAVAGEENIDSGRAEYRKHIFLRNDSLTNLFSADEVAEINKCMLRYMPFALSRYKRLKPVYVYFRLSSVVMAHTESDENEVLDWYFQD